MATEYPKPHRLAEIFSRLSAQGPYPTFDVAYRALCRTIDVVEDELSGEPNKPWRWRELNRIFPPQTDRMSTLHGGVVMRFDSKRHVTYIGRNGAIEVRAITRRGLPIETVYSQLGADGQGVVDLLPELRDRNL